MGKFGCPLFEKTKIKNLENKVPDYLRNREVPAEAIEKRKELMKSFVHWEREQSRQGISDDYRDLVATEELGLAVEANFVERYQAAKQKFEERQIKIRKSTSIGGKNRAADRAARAKLWKATAFILMKQILLTRKDMKDRSIAKWILKNWPDDGLWRPSLETLRSQIRTLKLVVS
jgi:hypothetical protein